MQYRNELSSRRYACLSEIIKLQIKKAQIKLVIYEFNKQT